MRLRNSEKKNWQLLYLRVNFFNNFSMESDSDRDVFRMMIYDFRMKVEWFCSYFVKDDSNNIRFN